MFIAVRTTDIQSGALEWFFVIDGFHYRHACFVVKGESHAFSEKDLSLNTRFTLTIDVNCYFHRARASFCRE